MALAPVCVWLADRSIVPGLDGLSYAGRVEIAADGSRKATLVDPDRLDYVPAVIEDYVTFNIVIPLREHGWPSTTSLEYMPGRADLYHASVQRSMQNVRLQADDPNRLAIDAMLKSEDPTAAAALWSTTSLRKAQPWTWPGSIFLWWLMLWFLCVVLLQVVRVLHVYWSAGRHAAHRERRSEGLCAACGYNMRGLEWAERCPECGTLVH